MSATTYYQPIKATYLSGGQGVDGQLRKVFGSNAEWEFTKADIDKLEALGALWPSSNDDNPFKTLIAAINEYGHIRVWSEF